MESHHQWPDEAFEALVDSVGVGKQQDQRRQELQQGHRDEGGRRRRSETHKRHKGDDLKSDREEKIRLYEGVKYDCCVLLLIFKGGWEIEKINHFPLKFFCRRRAQITATSCEELQLFNHGDQHRIPLAHTHFKTRLR